MNPNGLHFLLAFIAVLAGIGWTVDHRRRVTAERRRHIAERIAQAKHRRLMIALSERDAARTHADDAQLMLNAILGDPDVERIVHPSLRAVK